MTGHRRRTTLTTSLVLAVALGGCTPTVPDRGAPTPTPSGPAPTSQGVDLPDGAAGQQGAWMVEQLTGETSTDQGDVEERFADSFLAALPATEVVALLGRLGAQGPWVPSAADGGPGGIRVRIGNGTDELDMQLLVDDEGAITALLFTPPPPPRQDATSWDGLADEVNGMTASTSLYVGEVVDGRCVPLEGMPTGSDAGASLPVGSVVKLYVLAAVVEAVAAGALMWEDELTLTADVRSLPSGRLHEEPDGTVVTVREAAASMIAISDNTATDLLVDAVGRDAVERAFVDLGHADPEVNRPFLTTRDLFTLGWGGGQELRRRWRDADEAERRVILDELPSGDLDVEVAEIGVVAVWPFGIDWFATAADLCAAHAGLAALATTPAGVPVREILSANPGIEIGSGYDHVAFKGGSTTGTMIGSWYAERSQGPPVVVVLQSASALPQAAVHAETMVGIAQDAFRLVER